MTTYHLTPKSSNVKTGPIPVSTTSRDTCPTSCPFMGNGCYADNAPLRFHWDAVSRGERGGTLGELCESIKALPDGQVWRHNQGGDLPGKGERINRKELQRLTRANRGRKGFTYTHKPLDVGNNADAIREANRDGFVVNVSANTLADVDRVKRANVGPVVVVAPSDHGPETTYSADGHAIVTCPATYRDDITCADCKLCAKDRDCVVAFPAHGARTAKLDATLVRIGG